MAPVSGHGSKITTDSAIPRRPLVLGGAGFVLFFVLFMASCISIKRVTVDAGQAAVLTEQPMFFGHGGVDPEPVKTGAIYVARTTNVTIVDMTPQRFDEPLEDMMSSNSVPMSFHSVARLQVIDPVDLVRKFGPNWYVNNVQKMVQRLNRDEAKQHTMSELAIDQSAVNKMEAAVEKSLRAYLTREGIPVRCLEITDGRISPPELVVNQQKQTAEQQQRIQTEQQRKQAEDARLAAEQSRAKADKAYQDEMGLSGAQFVQLRQIELCSQPRSSCTVFLGANPSPVLNVGR